jgi:hypothetical protein
LILVRELDERLGLEAIMTEDLNDAARLSADPTFRLIGSPTRWDRSAALTSTLHWFSVPVRDPHPGQQESCVGDCWSPVSSGGSAQPHAARPVQEFPVSGGELDHAQTDRGESRASPGRAVPRVGFIVTNLPLPNRAVVRFYNKRGTAEQWIKEGKQAAHWTRLSCPSVPGE